MRSSRQVENWIRSARWAPSGGNAQPWHIQVTRRNDEVELSLSISDQYRRKHSPMEIDGLVAAMALGGFVRNLRDLCAGDGFRVEEPVFDTGADLFRSVVQLRITPGAGFDGKPSYSVSEIESRRTDRGAYRTEALSREVVSKLHKVLEAYPEISVSEFTNGETSKRELLKSIARLERIRWRNPILLDGLLHEITFPGQHRTTGIPASQLGVSVLDQGFLALVQKFPFLLRIFRTALVEIPVRQALREFDVGSERLLFLSLSGDEEISATPEQEFRSAIVMGECFQALWLEANRNGVSVQPLGLPLIALGYWRDPARYSLEDSEKREIEMTTREFHEHFGLHLKRLTLGFRLGMTKKLAPRSPRRDIAIDSGR